MNCELCNNLLQAYLDGELEGDKFTEIEHHLAHCPACKAELDRLLKVRGFLKDLKEVEVPAGEREAFINALRNRIESEESHGAVLRKPFNWRPALVTGIALVSVLIIITFLPLRSFVNQGPVTIAPAKGINAIEDAGVDFLITGGLSNHFLATQGGIFADPQLTVGEYLTGWKIFKDTHGDLFLPAE
jgi:hypothetical protein